MTTIEIVCYKYKPLKTGELPLKIRVTKDRKVRYVNLGVSTKPEHWDFKKNKPKANCPNREQLERLISNKVSELRAEIISLKSDNKEYTAQSLIQGVSKDSRTTTISELFLEHLKFLQECNRTGYYLSVRQTYNSLLNYSSALDFPFNAIDIDWLRGYEYELKKQGLSTNTIGIRFRNLRMIYNLAIERGLVRKELYPFDKYKVSKHNKATAKRALTKDDIQRIINYPIENKGLYTRLAVHLFAFSYYMGGINFVDMAHLKPANIIGDRLVYTRIKTSKLICLPLCPEATRIIDKYLTNNRAYTFPVFNESVMTEQKKQNRLHKVITKINRELKEIGEDLNLPIKLTTYVARHSFATVLKRAGVSTSLISESLGHSSEKVTQTYLDSFENSQLNEALSHLK